ncbi:MAG: FAD-binding protein [Candidatus Bathyarchaeia archaeon]
MDLERLADKVIDTDFLIVGGGLVGSIAAYRAKRNNDSLSVTIIDKAKMEYSGNGVGLDNFNHIPLKPEDYHRRRVMEEEVKKAVFGAERLKGTISTKLDSVQEQYRYISLPVLKEIGVIVGEDDGTIKVIQGYRKGTVWGRVEYDSEGKPTEPLFGTLSRASDLKPKLGAAVRKIGVKVMDRTMLTGIIVRDGRVVGATALNTRTGEFYVFRSKAMLISTGGVSRLYPYQYAPYPNDLFYTLTSPVNHGGGHICALEAGARLYSMEMAIVYIVSKGMNHSSGGGACNWFFKMYNSKGEVLEDKYPHKVVTKAGGTIPGVNFLFAPDMERAEVMHDVILSRKDLAEDDEVIAVYFTAATEPPRALKFHKLAGHLRNEAPAECIPVLVGIGMFGGGIFRENEHSETAVRNLFVAGDAAGRGGSFGLTWGCLIADEVCKRMKDMDFLPFGAEEKEQIARQKARVFAPLGRRLKYEVHPLELEHYVRWVNMHYVGIYRNEGKLKRALELIERAKEAILYLVARNPHELMRCLEVQDIIELSEMHATCALIRTESRLEPVHYREDFPRQDPSWDGVVITIKREKDGKTIYAREKLD